MSSWDETALASHMQAADQNLHLHVSWVQERLPGMQVTADDELMIVDAGLPSDTFNLVCRARIQASRLHARVHGAIEHFKSRGHPFSWWVSPRDEPATLADTLKTAGLAEAESELAMVADLAVLTVAPAEPAGLRIERVSSARQIQQYAQLLSALWQPPDRAVLAFYDAATQVLLDTRCPLWLYLGSMGGEPVATAELAVRDSVAGLYNVSTAAPYRGYGIGSAMTWRPVLDAQAAGNRLAVLQAAAEGVGVYTRVGFQVIGRYVEYKLGSE